jgi:hypothetical protein
MLGAVIHMTKAVTPPVAMTPKISPNSASRPVSSSTMALSVSAWAIPIETAITTSANKTTKEMVVES